MLLKQKTCSHLCTQYLSCLSYNYKVMSVGRLDRCELNNATRQSVPDSYIDNPLYNHYYDLDTETSRSCLDYLRYGATRNGIYDITDISGDSYPVWCDVTSEPRSAWTLIMSHAFRNKDQQAFCRKTLTEDVPVNQDNPNWEAYRLSLRRMQFLFNQSTHWRVTSSSYKYGVDFRDYVRASLSAFDILSYLGRGECKNVEYINIRGINASFTTVPFWQSLASPADILHTDSSLNPCAFDARQGAVASENNFGLLCIDTNPAFRASESADSTNEHWMGGYL
ncbi:uncharacterized protein LOC116302418 [Actinia tenebrosa]|uniref:Uncharacterized protein LOC116302418 n=1 Tax=Actinia tenebrosa TaxID=6105 RepID=A0A6P8IMG0_ACTTE|nr:uncharacterized protein LOC116302418 [Actinia tenebrosa]